MPVSRGDVVLTYVANVGSPGGKVRPALVIQSDLFSEHPSLTVLPVTSELRRTPIFRIGLQPTADNGLEKPSQIMIDKIHTLPREKIEKVFGRVGDEILLKVNRALAVFFGFA